MRFRRAPLTAFCRRHDFNAPMIQSGLDFSLTNHSPLVVADIPGNLHIRHSLVVESKLGPTLDVGLLARRLERAFKFLAPLYISGAVSLQISDVETLVLIGIEVETSLPGVHIHIWGLSSFRPVIAPIPSVPLPMADRPAYLAARCTPRGNR